MSRVQDGQLAQHRLPSVARGILFCALLLGVACGDASTPPPGRGGSGGTGGSAGSGGTAGQGGVNGGGGSSGIGGSGAVVGSGGNAGTGGSPGTGGNAGTGGMGPCVTDALCRSCPDGFLCDQDDDCFSGYVCVPSGCETHEGAAIKQCQPSRGGSCADVSECPDQSNYACMPVGASAPRCVRITPGCSGETEAYDCVPGFSCEGGTCVDRRVPCDDFRDCPKNHVCSFKPTGSFCARTFRTCHVDEDCNGFGSFCADVDGNGSKECAGELGGSGEACVNADCDSVSAPVCEADGSGTLATCGGHGLCLDGGDCAAGFSCVELGQDGRKECVLTGGSCSNTASCPLREVCAAPRNGNPPSCQSGTAP
jgi:hypothetical protein